MKTYFLNIPNEIKKISQKLDAQTILCSKTWEAFNDEGNKQVFIFQKDGKLLITNNGNVTKSTWQYIPDNNSIIITVGEQATMLRPAFIEGVVFAIQKDGTDECIFLIGEKEKNICPKRTLAELESYFAKRLEESPEYIAAKQLEQQKKDQEQQKIEQEKQQEEQQVEQERMALIVAEHQDEIDALVKQKKGRTTTEVVIAGVVLVISMCLAFLFDDNHVMSTIFVIIVLFAFIAAFILTVRLFSVKENAEKEVISKYNQ